MALILFSVTVGLAFALGLACGLERNVNRAVEALVDAGAEDRKEEHVVFALKTAGTWDEEREDVKAQMEVQRQAILEVTKRLEHVEKVLIDLYLKEKEDGFEDR